MCREKMGTMLNLSIYKATIYYISRIELTYDSKRTLGLPDDSGERIRSRPLAGTQSDGQNFERTSLLPISDFHLSPSMDLCGMAVQTSLAGTRELRAS
jgi:hypothetical protein